MHYVSTADLFIAIFYKMRGVLHRVYDGAKHQIARRSHQIKREWFSSYIYNRSKCNKWGMKKKKFSTQNAPFFKLYSIVIVRTGRQIRGDKTWCKFR